MSAADIDRLAKATVRAYYDAGGGSLISYDETGKIARRQVRALLVALREPTQDARDSVWGMGGELEDWRAMIDHLLAE